jgi:tetratricopeptide (TPR) repeat protein
MGGTGIEADTARFLVRGLTVASLSWLALGAGPAAGQSEYNYTTCFKLDIDSPPALVRGCTAAGRAGALGEGPIVRAYLYGGNDRYNSGDDRGAIATYDRVLRLDSHNADARYGRGNAYYRLRDFRRALADYGEAVRRNPDHPSFLIGRANARYMLHDYDGALADYSEAIGRNAYDSATRIGRGNVLAVRRDFVRAIADYDEGIRLNPNDANAYYVRGIARAGQRDWEGALIDFNRSITIDPSVAAVHASRARTHVRLGNREWAEADFREAERLAQGNAPGLNSLCWNLATAGADLDRARAHCEASLGIEPDNIETLDSRGFISLRQGRFREAWADYDRALRGDRNNPGMLYGRGLAARRLGRAAAARADIGRATAIDPGIAQAYADYGLAPDG